MRTTITLVHDNPRDPGAFEAGYPDQLALATGGVRIVFAGIEEVGPVTTSRIGAPSAHRHRDRRGRPRRPARDTAEEQA